MTPMDIQLNHRSKVIHISKAINNCDITKETCTHSGVVGVFIHKYDLDLVKVGQSSFSLILDYFFWHLWEFTFSVHISLIYRSDLSLAHTVIQMTLTYFCAYDTFKDKKFKTPHLGDYYSYSDVVVQNHIARNGLTG